MLRYSLHAGCISACIVANDELTKHNVTCGQQPDECIQSFLSRYSPAKMAEFNGVLNNLTVMYQFVPYTQANTLRGRKDTLTPVFFY